MKRKRIIANMVFALVMIAIMVGIMWGFSVQLTDTSTTETYETLNEISQHHNKAFLDKINSKFSIMEMVSVLLKDIPDWSSQDTKIILQSAVDKCEFIRLIVCNEDGDSFSNIGDRVNVSHRDYFKQAMQGFKNVNELDSTLVEGQKTLTITIPIKNDDAVIGVLCGAYPVSKAGELLLNTIYFSESYGFIVSLDGNIILQSQHEDNMCDENNIFTYLAKTTLKDISLEEIKTAMKKGSSISFAFKYNGNRRYVSFTPSFINNWYTLSFTSDSFMLQREKQMSSLVLTLVLQIIVAGLILLTWIALNYKKHNRQIVLANEKYQSLLSNINGGVIVTEHARTPENTIVLYASQGFTDMTGYTLEDIQSLFNGKYLDVMLEEDRQEVFDTYLKQLQVGNTYKMPYRIHKKNGDIIWVMDNGFLVEDNGELRNHTIVTDITLVKQQEEELRLSQERFTVAINSSNGALFELDLKKQIYTHFENAERIFGVSAEKIFADTLAYSTLPYNEFIDKITHYFFHPDDYLIATNNTMEELLETGSTSYQARIRRGDNSFIWARFDLTLCKDNLNRPWRIVGIISDIDETKKHADYLETKTQIDQMTGLYNKMACSTMANASLQNNTNSLYALIVLDIDNFKGINDTLGHAFGDLVLIDVATKLKDFFDKDDIVARIGGDEYAILMKDAISSNNILKKVTATSAMLRQVYQGEKGDYKITCSMGVIVIEDKLESFDSLYRKADAALYKAKQGGKDTFVLYDESEADSYSIETKRTNDEELHNLRTSHNIEERIFELLYSSKDFNININMALAAIGQEYHVSRVAIYENNEDNTFTSNTYEWCEKGIPPQLEIMQNVPMSFENSSILESFDSNGLLYCKDTLGLPSYMRLLFEKQGIKSALQTTIINEGKISGFIGFDDCIKNRVWTLEEIEDLSFLSKIIDVFLYKKRTEAVVLANLSTRLQILDVLPDFICVVNPRTHSIEYTNMQMKTLIPSAIMGSFCFKTLRGGRNSPCQTCLVEKIKQGDTQDLTITSEDGKTEIKVNALTINWTNDQKMVLLYGKEGGEF
ncbi:MAG: diguanylate cyclase [Clostridia bacterium]